MFGYAIASYALFGQSTSDFSNILFSFFSTLRMLCGYYRYQEMYEADPKMAAIIFFTFLVRV